MISRNFWKISAISTLCLIITNHYCSSHVIKEKQKRLLDPKSRDEVPSNLNVFVKIFLVFFFLSFPRLLLYCSLVFEKMELISQRICIKNGKHHQEAKCSRKFFNLEIFSTIFLRWRSIQLCIVVLKSVEKWEIYSHRKNISSNQLFSNFFSKNVAFTNFLSKMWMLVGNLHKSILFRQIALCCLIVYGLSFQITFCSFVPK